MDETLGEETSMSIGVMVSETYIFSFYDRDGNLVVNVQCNKVS